MAMSKSIEKLQAAVEAAQASAAEHYAEKEADALAKVKAARREATRVRGQMRTLAIHAQKLEEKVLRLEQLESFVAQRAFKVRMGLMALSKMREAESALRTECRSESESNMDDAIEAILRSLKNRADELIQPIQTRLDIDNPPAPCAHGFKDCPTCQPEVEEIEEEDEDADDGEKGQG
jgi:hypothetical protein